jgi:UDP-N-acetylglucosamine--N-acetylmuramyl-(pentapeptide) pyrophosphoryl-undecaprenol N-acetylglucosamine transferase
MAEKLRVVIAGGGTGGHVFPALNIAEGMKNRWQCEFLFFGTERGLESKKIPEHGYKIKLIPVAGLHRRITIKNLSFPFKLLKSIQICRKTMREFQPHLVIGSGGYVMGPVLKTAIGMGIPTVIQEQNSFPGVTTRLLAGKTDIVFLGDSEARTYLGNAKKLIDSGNPISLKKSTSTKNEIYKEFGLKSGLKTILVFGGSQGALNINRAIKQILVSNSIKKDTQILWQVGERNFAEYDDFIKESKKENVIIRAFIDEMDKAYAIADLVICRAGAITISELMATGSPAILVPLPSAAGNHQFKNACGLEQRKAAIMVEDDKNLSDNLTETVDRLISKKELRDQLAKNINDLFKQDTMEIIIDAIDELLKEKYDSNFILKN